MSNPSLSRGELVRYVLIYAAVAVLVLFTCVPILWLVIMSISSAQELTAVPLHWIPKSPDFSRYARLLGLTSDGSENIFLPALRNSVITAGGATLVAMAAAIPAAYAMSRRNAPRAMLFVMLATFMVPPITYALPLYTGLGKIGLLNTSAGLIIIYSALLLPFAVWLTKTNIDILPVSLEEAAMLDGAGTLRIMWSVLLPIARPALVAAAMLSFLTAWDEFFYALLFTSDLRAKTLPVAIADFAAGRVTDYGMVSAIGVLAAIPPVILAIFFQKSLIAGLSSGSVKG
ncbi:carbohydrate ABC transporter membrane protein 2, CUT1 family [Faunimonas pinastri]|uniref:Carbohydrate ABC transporter membrane protein 2, CUT1 family n=1 Tax=Faunimonas pinastri TaxID=1855383 RepID=A0A1H9PBI1_9HYPH|nr:carbohydrate ABC transporter permease [Faunimonas pinastri]SER45521.1 carbohydrate ABC transporter membrane protein 2, CUT1 family [Faunimonas pinastri]